MRFAVNVSMLFTELPLLRRPAAVAAAGFDALEMWWPFSTPTPAEADIDLLARAIEDAGLTLAALNLYAGDLGAGDRGVLSHPDRADAFAASVPVGVALAGRLGCKVLHALYGNRRPDLPVEVQDELAVRHLAAVAAAARPIDARVVVEAMNPKEQPTFPLHRTAAAFELVGRIHAETGERLGLLYDAYHMQRSEGDLIATIDAHGADFTHVQIADVPTRTAPGTGEIAYARVLASLSASGYDGFVGLEYRPSGPSEDSFGWIEELALRRRHT